MSEEEAIAFCHAQCDEIFQTLDGNCGTVTANKVFDFFSKKILAVSGLNSLADLFSNIPDDNERSHHQMELLVVIRVCGEMLSGAATSSGEDQFNKVKDKLKKAFDKCDITGDGVLDREEIKAGIIVIFTTMSKRAGIVESNFDESQFNHFLDNLTNGSGKISFDDMLDPALSVLSHFHSEFGQGMGAKARSLPPPICEGKAPAEFFADLWNFSLINAVIDIFLGDLLKDGDLEKVNAAPFYCLMFYVLK
jgi:Ca2+-binding EF-hand superfamily protein